MKQQIIVELPIEIDYSYISNEPDEIEINQIYLYSDPLSNKQETQLIEKYGKNELEKLLIILTKEDIEEERLNTRIDQY